MCWKIYAKLNVLNDLQIEGWWIAVKMYTAIIIIIIITLLYYYYYYIIINKYMYLNDVY